MRIIDKVKKLKDELNETFNNGLEIAVKEIFEKHPNLNRFAVYGYTPLFNDGEPCEHESSYVFCETEIVNYSGTNYIQSDLEDCCGETTIDIEEFFEYVHDDDNLTFTHINVQLTDEEIKSVNDDLNYLCEFTDHVHGTNYLVTFERDSENKDKFIINNYNYVCGN